MGENVLEFFLFFVQRNKKEFALDLNINITTNIKKEEAMGAEEEKKKNMISTSKQKGLGYHCMHT